MSFHIKNAIVNSHKAFRKYHTIKCFSGVIFKSRIVLIDIG